MRILPALMLCLLTGSAGFAAAQEDGEKVTVQLNENRGYWSSGGSPKKDGGQNLIYFSLAYRKAQYGVTMLGSYANTSYVYNGGRTNDFQMGSLLDSTVSGFYKFDNVKGFSVRAGLDLNLPTGLSSYTNEELGALFLDPVVQDLDLASSFGKGFDIAPNVVVSKSLAKVTVGLGMRYEIKGEYDPTKEADGDNYDPGDILTVIGSGMYRPDGESLLMGDLSMVKSARDKQGGEDVFKQGTIYTMNLRFIKKYEQFRATYGGSYGIQEKNQSLSGGGITTEDRNSNSNLYQLFANIGYPVTSRIGVNGILGYKNVASNGYDSDNTLYDGGYTKLYLGGGATMTASKKFFWKVDLRMYQISNKADALEPETATYSGGNIDIGFVYTFSP